MDLITLLVSAAIFVVSCLFLFRHGAKRARFVSLVNKLPGPPAYPIIGNALEMVVPRNRKYESHKFWDKYLSPYLYYLHTEIFTSRGPSCWYH
jgi:hypothetical protein